MYTSLLYNYSNACSYLGGEETGSRAPEVEAVIRAGVVGASGYAGGELVRLLLGHRGVAIVALASRGSTGKAAWEVYPGLRGYDLPRMSHVSAGNLASECDVVFIAAPAGAAAPLAKEILAVSSSTKIIDLGSDFRLKDPALYQEWYDMVHEAPELLAEAAYGLPELCRAEVRRARIVANPGCYPTASLLALAPLVAGGLIDLRSIVIDAKSGVSGAGRAPSAGYHFPECEENLRPYGILRHRHTPEIEQELRLVARRGKDEVRSQGKDGGDALVVSFAPHLVPMSRGILVTAYALLKHRAVNQRNEAPNECGNVCDAAGRDARARLDTDVLTSLYERFYAGERFVRVLREDLPQTKAVRGSNFCDIAVRADPRTGRVVAMSALDNLVKGAAGQAIQNMNVLFGLEESMGLEAPPVWP